MQSSCPQTVRRNSKGKLLRVQRITWYDLTDIPNAQKRVPIKYAFFFFLFFSKEKYQLRILTVHGWRDRKLKAAIPAQTLHGYALQL